MADEPETQPAESPPSDADAQREAYVAALQREREHLEKYGPEEDLAAVDEELARVARDAKPARKRAERR
jgi:hypothetical protein